MTIQAGDVRGKFGIACLSMMVVVVSVVSFLTCGCRREISDLAVSPSKQVNGPIGQSTAPVPANPITEPMRVGPGSTVVLRDIDKRSEVTYRLVYELVFDKDSGLGHQAMIHSPMGKALLGKQAGDSVTVQGPGGLKRNLTILSLTAPNLAPPIAKPEPVNETLELLDSTGETNDYSTTVTGRIRNNSRKNLSYVQVLFNLYDTQGNRVGSALANITGLGAGETWRFKAIGTTSAKRFKLDQITGY